MAAHFDPRQKDGLGDEVVFQVDRVDNSNLGHCRLFQGTRLSCYETGFVSEGLTGV